MYHRVFAELKLLPDNLALTTQYCKYTTGILIIDGKYVKVRGYTKKIPFIYLIDYHTHDILFGVLSSAEDEKTFLKIFQTLKQINDPLQVVVADDRSSLPLALKKIFPEVPLQLCLNHYLENIRITLHVRTEEIHRPFFNALQHGIFDGYEDDKKLNEIIVDLFKKYAEHFPVRQQILMEINRRRKRLFAYKTIIDCPDNTNLIELFNSHFNPRMKLLKGFKTKEHALLWLNGLIMRRRTQPFTDCDLKFKHLNGKRSLEMSIKKQAQWPDMLGIKTPKT